MLYPDPQFVTTLQKVIEFIGTFAFAVSGIRLAATKHFDWFGGFVCG
ncbi:MAG: TRIC cation channel family protein, partial [Prevotella sp.]